MGTGLKKEASAALSYVLGPITGIIFLVLDRDPLVRFHSIQSIVTLGILSGIGIFLSFIPFIQVVWVVYFVALLTGAYQASQGRYWEMPFLGKISKKLSS